MYIHTYDIFDISRTVKGSLTVKERGGGRSLSVVSPGRIKPTRCRLQSFFAPAE